MPVRTQVLALLHTLPAVPSSVIYTTPAGRTTIVKDVALMNLSGAARDVSLSVRRAGVLGTFVWLPAMANLVLVNATRDVAMEPGDELLLTVGSGAAIGASFRLLISGVELDGVAPA